MIDIAQNIRLFREEIPEHVKLVAVTKKKPVDDIMKAYKTGYRIFGENRVQELAEKQPMLPSDIEWHMIGHLQTNKVKYVTGFVEMIHSVDTIKLLNVINKEAIKVGRVIDCLLQFHIATEETKYGFSLEEGDELIKKGFLDDLNNVRICGVMGMASFTDDTEKVRSEFKLLKRCFDHLKRNYFGQCEYFSEVSMGMSGDYLLAIEEGSTIIRIGSLIFGERH